MLHSCEVGKNGLKSEVKCLSSCLSKKTSHFGGFLVKISESSDNKKVGRPYSKVAMCDLLDVCHPTKKKKKKKKKKKELVQEGLDCTILALVNSTCTVNQKSFTSFKKLKSVWSEL